MKRVSPDHDVTFEEAKVNGDQYVVLDIWPKSDLLNRAWRRGWRLHSMVPVQPMAPVLVVFERREVP